jgi:hypothetical protein
MSETKGLYSLLMLALIFNIAMYGIFDYVNSEGYLDVSCPNPQLAYNVTYVEGDPGVPQSVLSCEPEGLPWWYYAVWGIINGVLVYAFIPFVK